ncbi:hypothetical protein [Aureibaculum luteum]|uniref:hypothetical protein n=1 Tax=Aureibaculum luteum TaxID=1548456 RepID=UPI000E51636E|nr:hypothetical protein [Aureibaculum luteum]
MKKQKLSITTLLFVLIFSMIGCSEKEMNNLESNILGTWDKDWNKSLAYVESKPELKDYLFGLKMVAKMQGNHKYSFNKDRTFELILGKENLAGEKSEGIWNISLDSILKIETTKSTKSGVFSGGKNTENEILTYKIISLDSDIIELKQITETLSEVPEFMIKTEE